MVNTFVQVRWELMNEKYFKYLCFLMVSDCDKFLIEKGHLDSVGGVVRALMVL